MKNFGDKELTSLFDRTTRSYVEIPMISRFPGMKRDLTERERVSVAAFLASVSLLNQLGCINQAAFDELDLRLINQTIHHDLLDEETEGVVFKSR